MLCPLEGHERSYAPRKLIINAVVHVCYFSHIHSCAHMDMNCDAVGTVIFAI